MIVDANVLPYKGLAVEHGVPVVSADGDFARFSEIRWENPFR